MILDSKVRRKTLIVRRESCLHTFQRDFFDGLRIDVVGIGRSGLGSGVVVGRGWRGCIRRHAPVLLPSSANAIQPDAFFQHAHSDAFLEAAGLASLPPALIDLAIVGGRARVFDVSCNGNYITPIRHPNFPSHPQYPTTRENGNRSATKIQRDDNGNSRHHVYTLL